MSAGNWFETRRKAHGLREKSVTAAYTVRVGGASDNFIADRIITVPSASAVFTITVPSGTYRGQRLLVVVTKTTDLASAVTVATGTENYIIDCRSDYVSLEWIGCGNKGWIYLSKCAS